MWKTAWTVTWKAFLLFALLVVALGALLLLINVRDEALDPRAAALLKPAELRVPEAQNGYADLVGLNAPAGEKNSREWGRQWLAEAARVDDGASSQAFAEKWKSTAKPTPAFCNPSERSCLDKAAQSRKDAQALLEANREMFERYARLQQYPGMEELLQPLAPETPMPAYSRATFAQSLLFARVGLDAAEGRLAAAVDRLERDVALQHRILTSATHLLTKLMASEMYARDMLLLSDLMRSQRAAMAPLAARIAKMAAPLSEAELSMADPLKGEFRWLANYMLQFGRPGSKRSLAEDGIVPGPLDWLSVQLLQPNATVNRQYLVFEPSFKTSATVAEVESQRKAVEAVIADLKGVHMVYNPVGKILLSVGAPDFSDYQLRMADVDSIARLVALQASIVGAGVGKDKVAAHVAAQGKASANARPVEWDAHSGQLGFEARSRKWRNQKVGGGANRVAVTL